MILVQLLVAAAAAVILTSSVAAINRMTPATHHGIRLAYVLISAGAFGELAAILNGHTPGIAETLFVLGLGLLDLLDRRTTVRCPYLPGGKIKAEGEPHEV